MVRRVERPKPGRTSRCSRFHRVQLSRSLQSELLNAIHNKQSSNHFAISKAPDTPVGQPQKRRLDDDDENSDSSPLPQPKRPRVTVAAGVPLIQPTPRNSYTSFLQDFVEPTESAVPDLEGSVHSLVTNWLASLGSDSLRDSDCRSDSCIAESPTGPPFIPRRSARSLPNMSSYGNDFGYGYDPPVATPPSTIMPPPPTPPRGRPRTSSRTSFNGDGSVKASVRSSSAVTVEKPGYRGHLQEHGIFMRKVQEPLPTAIGALVDTMAKKRSSPEPSVEALQQDEDLSGLVEDGVLEFAVEEYFKGAVFPPQKRGKPLRRTDRLVMEAHAVPNNPMATTLISKPAPDILYGYEVDSFPVAQRPHIRNTPLTATSTNLALPFFVVEFKGDGGSLFVAENQSLGGSASCVNLAERLYRQLQAYGDASKPANDASGSGSGSGAAPTPSVQQVDTAAFSVAMNGLGARLFVSWKNNDLEYYTRCIRTFCVQDPEHFIAFRRHVRNIVDWGCDRRLKDIRNTIDTILEANRKLASERAKSRRPSMSNDGESDRGKKPRGPDYPGEGSDEAHCGKSGSQQ